MQQGDMDLQQRDIDMQHGDMGTQQGDMDLQHRDIDMQHEDMDTDMGIHYFWTPAYQVDFTRLFLTNSEKQQVSAPLQVFLQRKLNCFYKAYLSVFT